MIFDPELFGRQMADEVARAIGAITGPLLKRTLSLEARVAAAEALGARVAVLEEKAPVPGPQGPVGLPGERGEAGPAGRDGADGKDGAPGLDGRDGAPGPRGETGEKGEQGERGETGLPGPQGDRGERGEPGLDGKDGAPGRDGAPGLDGKDGAPGACGAKGERGDPGPQGERGEQGLTGEDGTPGLQGLAGERGEKGLDGRDGQPGVPGRDGKDGLGFDDLTITHDGERGLAFMLQRGERTKEFAFTVPAMIYRGVWIEKAWTRGDAVTWRGSLWIATRDTSTKPDEASSDWVLAAKKGRKGGDGKDAVSRHPGAATGGGAGY